MTRSNNPWQRAPNARHIQGAVTLLLGSSSEDGGRQAFSRGNRANGEHRGETEQHGVEMASAPGIGSLLGSNELQKTAKDIPKLTSLGRSRCDSARSPRRQGIERPGRPILDAVGRPKHLGSSVLEMHRLLRKLLRTYLL